MFSKKATKFDKIFTTDQIDGEDFINFCGLLGKYELYVGRQLSTFNQSYPM